MPIYLFIFSALIALSTLPNWKSRFHYRLNTKSGQFSFLLLVFFAAFRKNTGTDFVSYSEIWAITPDLSIDSIKGILLGFLEPLFVLTNIFLKSINSNQSFFFAAYAGLTIFIFHKSIINFNVNYGYSYVVYFCIFYLPYTFNGMRQALSMSLFLLSIKYILRNNTLTVWLIAILAIGFHLTGIVILIAYYFNKICEKLNWTPRNIFWVGIIFSFSIGLSGVSGKVFFELFSYKTETYSELFSDGITSVNLLLRISLAFLLVFFSSKHKYSSSIRQIINIYLLGLFFYISFIEFGVLATRFNMFFRILEVILLPIFISKFRGLEKVFVFFCIGIFLFATVIIIASHPDYEYSSIFN